MGDFIRSFFPPDISAQWLQSNQRHLGNPYLNCWHPTRRRGWLLFALGRPRLPFSFLFNTLRSVPELVWATLTALSVGLGPFAGAFGFSAPHHRRARATLYRRFDNAPPAAARALRLSGAGTGLSFLYGTPRCRPATDCLHALPLGNQYPHGRHPGFVGAGGLWSAALF